MASSVTVLYQWGPSAGLPSLTAASLQAEAYLRFAKVDFCVETSSTASASPAGVLPALERGAEIATSAPGDGDLAAARAIIDALRRTGADLDAALTPAQRADALAYTSLITSRLDVATAYCTWLEPRGFKEFRAAAFGSLPFPLGWLVPRNAQRDAQRLLLSAAGGGAAALDGHRIYNGATEALAALGDRLRASPGPFLLGAAPCSADALLFGHLAFYRHSPIAAPVLRAKVEAQRALCAYVDDVLSTWFAAPAPPPPPPPSAAAAAAAAAGWSDAAQGQSSRARRAPTVEEARMWQGSKYWLGGAAAAIGTYVLLGGGGYVQVLAAGDDDEGDDVLDDDDDDDDDGDDDGGFDDTGGGGGDQGSGGGEQGGGE